MGGSVREVCTPRVGVAARQHACQGIAEQRHPVHIADRSALAGMTEAQQRDAHYRACVDREDALPPDVVRSLVGSASAASGREVLQRHKAITVAAVERLQAEGLVSRKVGRSVLPQRRPPGAKATFSI